MLVSIERSLLELKQNHFRLNEKVTADQMRYLKNRLIEKSRDCRIDIYGNLGRFLNLYPIPFIDVSLVRGSQSEDDFKYCRVSLLNYLMTLIVLSDCKINFSFKFGEKSYPVLFHIGDECFNFDYLISINGFRFSVTRS